MRQHQRFHVHVTARIDPFIRVHDLPLVPDLDPAATDALDARLRGLRAEGAAVLVTVHDLARAAALATRVLILHAGRLAWASRGAVPEPAALAEAYRTVTAGRG